jgi:hypothetical protein
MSSLTMPWRKSTPAHAPGKVANQAGHHVPVPGRSGRPYAQTRQHLDGEIVCPRKTRRDFGQDATPAHFVFTLKGISVTMKFCL